MREHDAALAGPGDELARIAEELREASVELRSYLTGLDADPAVLDRIEERLEQLAELRRRFGGVDEAADLRPRAEAAAAELAEGERADERIARAAAAVAAAEKTAERLATALHKGREKAAKPFARGVEGHLADMGMDGARLEVSIAEAPLGARGRDAVELRLAANPGLPAGPLGSVASGGELSRIALAVRLAARDGGATEMLVFDEVDAGIGGRTARVLTDKLRELAATAQVLCITHLPQIAAAADRHFLVEKTQGETSEAHVAELSLRRGARGARAHARRRRGRHRRARARGQPARRRALLVTRSRDARDGRGYRWRTHAHPPPQRPRSPSSCSRPRSRPPRRRRRARRSSRPAATPRWEPAARSASSSRASRSRSCRCACRWPARTSARTRARAPTLAFAASTGKGRANTYSRIYLPADGATNVSFVVDDNRRQPEIYLSLQLKGGIGHVSVHARSNAAREACEGALGFDVRVRPWLRASHGAQPSASAITPPTIAAAPAIRCQPPRSAK